MWRPVSGLISNIKKCEAAGATMPAVVMAYICIDTLAFLALPEGREAQGRGDFIAWVDAYLTGHPDQPYQYRGVDVYGARCAVLHAFGTEASFHEQNPDAKKFGYSDGGRHAYDATVDDRLVIIGTASFLNDVVHAIGAFVAACQADASLRSRVEARLPRVLTSFPFPTPPADGVA